MPFLTAAIISSETSDNLFLQERRQNFSSLQIRCLEGFSAISQNKRHGVKVAEVDDSQVESRETKDKSMQIVVSNRRVRRQGRG
jgi:hypothetical protein